MKTFAPKYYLDFKCKKDKCKHSCCVGWEIDVDNATLKIYQNLQTPYGKIIRSSIEKKPTPHFKLNPNERCPHLDENGLCKIIINEGEDYLCDICREHPRFYNVLIHGEEVGLGLSCEECCRLVLTSNSFNEFVVVSEDDFAIDEIEFDVLPYREKIYQILLDESKSYSQKLNCIYRDFEVTPFSVSNEKWKSVISSLEFLDESRRRLFLNYAPLEINENHSKTLLRFLAYLVFRHLSKATSKREIIGYLGFCLFCERLLNYLINSVIINSESDLFDFARIISEEIEYSEDNTLKIVKLFLTDR